MNQNLIDTALKARQGAYAKYSNFKVGAALVTKTGQIYSGCNIENASYSLTMCAERTALYSAIAAGEREFTRLVVASDNGVSPCGACRQVIWELCGNIPVTLVNASGETRETSSADLLPNAFGEKDLNT